MRDRIKTPSAGTVIALVALFVALGSGAYATHTHRMGTQDLQNRAVTAPKIANNAVIPRTIRRNAVRPPKIAQNAVRPRQLAGNAVRHWHVHENAIRARHILDGQVTQSKLAPGATLPGAPIGSAGGDLAGSYPNPTIAAGAVGGDKLAERLRPRWAVVASNGALERGTAGVESEQTATGEYRVKFDRNITQCSWIAGRASPDTVIPGGGHIQPATFLAAGTTDVVRVRTWDRDGELANRNFQVQVVC